MAILSILRTKGNRAWSNRFYGKGFADMAILPDGGQYQGTGIIIEFKVAQKKNKPETVKKLTIEALEQIIVKEYDQAFSERQLHTKLIYGVVFHERTCQAALLKNYGLEILTGDNKIIEVKSLKKRPKLVEKCLGTLKYKLSR
jgi:hypothetical protein